jgi:hypothetical protein
MDNAVNQMQDIQAGVMGRLVANAAIALPLKEMQQKFINVLAFRVSSYY